MKSGLSLFLKDTKKVVEVHNIKSFFEKKLVYFSLYFSYGTQSYVVWTLHLWKSELRYITDLSNSSKKLNCFGDIKRY